MKLYVYGTGCGAGELIEKGLDPALITAFVDGEGRTEPFLGREVLRPEELAERDYDLILVASRQCRAILETCLGLGIRREALLFLKNNYALQDLNGSYALAEKLLGPELLERLTAPHRIIREPERLAESPLTERDLENDYVRVRTLELLCAELAEVPGALAELGVYQGSFARCLNALLPERTLYLFDTFSGFDGPEAAYEQAEGRCTEAFTEAHRRTAVEQVLSLLPHPERAVVRQGLFPETAQGLEAERFALVSLDADFERSTYEGLKFFVPRVSPGGYILLHDYNSSRLLGVRAALRRYERDSSRRLPAVPLCDAEGTLVLAL